MIAKEAREIAEKCREIAGRALMDLALIEIENMAKSGRMRANIPYLGIEEKWADAVVKKLIEIGGYEAHKEELLGHPNILISW